MVQIYLEEIYPLRDELFISGKPYIIKYPLLINLKKRGFYFPTNADFVMWQRKR